MSTVLHGVRLLGCAVVEGVIDPSLLSAVRDGMLAARRRALEEVGAERLERAGELGVARIPMRAAPVFFRLLELPAILEVVDHTLSNTAVLHLQNGLILPPATPQQRKDLFQLSFHMDFRRVLNGYVCSINTFFAIDDFTHDNGATLVVPGTHQAAEPPDEAYLRNNAVTLVCPAGSMIVFDSTLWHAAGRNLSDRDRMAVNQQFTRSYFKQQIDYVRALGDEVVQAQSPRTQQLLGWHTRVVTSLDEYYRPAEERLYRAGQG
ncbi:MAG TPA: phytanoyl-CoA dioxygenase family protein [Thermoanaerobaculia bacterium]|nr:phytanoyl-CoA dioxygenase family protein [Thermoanaerobaculia bacterium]